MIEVVTEIRDWLTMLQSRRIKQLNAQEDAYFRMISIACVAKFK